MKLSEFLEGLEFHSPKKSSEYVGRKETNPVMVLEENVAAWIRVTDLDDLQMSLDIFEGQVCIEGYPAIYSPQFWIANASLTAIHEVMSGYLKTADGLENVGVLSELLFDLWIKLLNSGPGSTHLHMLNIVLKTPDDLLWKHLETLRGDDLKTLIRTLQTDFDYKEEVTPDHYATLMETHIDKVFRTIFSSNQFEDSRRELLDLQIFYLSKMNHVPPHIGPRLSHLCFLICNRYEMENPYLGMDDWVMMRQHLKSIKDVITHTSFTKASEAQYRAPIVLEKILHAAVIDNMLDVMCKDFMSILQTITNNVNSKTCTRLYAVFRTGLFEHIDLKRGFEECPYWLFKQCIHALGQLANSNMLESHIDDFIITTQNIFLLKFTKLSANEVAEWHKLLVNYILSGRKKLVTEAQRLLSNAVLVQNGVFDWKKHVKEARMLIDIIADFPREFLQNDEMSSSLQSAEAFSNFLQELLKLISDMEGGSSLQAEIRPNVHRCIIKCIEKDMEAKAAICFSCVTSSIPDFTDQLYLREVLFAVEKLLKSEDCPRCCDLFTKTVGLILDSCLQTFKEKGYIAVDFNTLLMSMTLRCATAPDIQDEVTSSSKDMYGVLYEGFVKAFVQMHCDKRSLKTIKSLVYQTLNTIQEAIAQGTNCGRGVEFLEFMGTRSFKLLLNQTQLIVELFIDWCCVDLRDIIKQLYSHSPECLIARLQDLFNLVKQKNIDNKHKAFDVLYEVSKKCAQLFQESDICILLETYPEEDDKSQDFIIKIILEVLNQRPQLLKQHVHAIVDETIFSTSYFAERCSILSKLSAQNKEIVEKTEDFLMKYITDKDDQVALTAMKALIPLIKHIMWPVRKARLKVLIKSIKCKEVRTLCGELVPELRSNNRKPETNQSKDAKETKATTKQNTVRTTVRQSPQPHNIKLNPNTVKALTKPVVREIKSSSSTRNRPASNLKVTPDNRDKNTLSSDKVTVDKPGSAKSERKDTAEPGDKDIKGEISEIGDKHAQDVDIMKPLIHDKGDVKSPLLSPLPDIKTEGFNNTTKLEHPPSSINSYGADVVKPDLEPENPNNNLEMADTNTDKTQTLSQFTNKEPDKADSVPTSNKLPDDTHEKSAMSTSSDKNTEAAKTISLFGSEKDKFKLMAFGGILKDAGFDSDIAYKARDVINMDARLTVLCISRQVHSETIREVTEMLMESKSVIWIKFDQTAQTAIKPPEKTCIRMFTKPGETTLRGHWPALKFYELLMHLNYQGILPQDHLLSQDFKDWWKPPNRSNFKSVTGSTPKVTEDRATPSQGSAAAVFISYHWGKQKQVEPLYKFLMNQGISCWVGLHQIGGSESLYNKISQGIQECRVVLACVTPQYTCTENCKQEVNIALGLNRPVIPLLVKTNWPISDEIGEKLTKLNCLKMVMTADGKIDMKVDVIKTLLNYIKKYVPEVSLQYDKTEQEENNHPVFKKKSVDQDMEVVGNKNIRKKSVKEDMHLVTDESRILKDESKDQFPVNHDPVKVKGMSKNSVNVRKSISLCDLERNRSFPYSQTDGEKDRTRSSMDVDRRKSHYDIPHGVVIDELGYTVKTNRSKSCIIL